MPKTSTTDLVSILSHLFFTREEVRVITRAPSLSSVDHWIATGKLRTVKPGRSRLIPRKALAEFLGVDLSDLAA